MHDLKDKVVLITGAANGVGAGVVKLLMKEGVKVVYTSTHVKRVVEKHVAILDIAKDAGKALQDDLNAKYGANKVKFYVCDVTDEDEFLRIMGDVKNRHGYIDVVINNAGIMNDSWQTYKKEILINVLSLVTGSLRALEMMRRDEGGRGGTIINLSSVAALCQTHWLPVYWATKSAVLQFSNCLGLEEQYNRSGVRVLAVCLGPTDTALLMPQQTGSFDKNFEAEYAEIHKHSKLQHLDSAAKGIIEAYKRGESGSTWLAAKDEPAKEITADIKKAYDVLAVHAGP